MSSTIGHADPRRPVNDFFPTPAWATRTLLAYLDRHGLTPEREPMFLVDPGAGTGAIATVLKEWKPEADIMAIENDPALCVVLREVAAYYRFVDVGGDFLAWTPNYLYDLLVCNPPYSGPKRKDLAMGFVKRGREVARQAWFLLRLNWLGSQKRAPYFLHVDDRPMVLVMSKRPSFRGGGNDSTEYAWMGWMRDHPETWGSWDVLEAVK